MPRRCREEARFPSPLLQAGETVRIAVLRDGNEVQLEATFQEARRR